MPLYQSKSDGRPEFSSPSSDERFSLQWKIGETYKQVAKPKSLGRRLFPKLHFVSRGKKYVRS